jgi:hypothetical protein
MNYTLEAWNTMYAKCTEFAGQQVGTSRSKYSQRGQSNSQRITKQIADGKMGEMICRQYLLSNGYPCNEPDFEIYTARHKSFDADLQSCSPVHVKTQCSDSASRYGASWVFQAGGAGFGNKDPLLDSTSSDWAMFVTLGKLSAQVIGPLDMCEVRKHLKDPVLERLKGIKKCVYLKDIADLAAVPVPVPLPIATGNIIEQLDFYLTAWIDSDYDMVCRIDPQVGLTNEWVFESDGEVFYSPRKMIAMALGKLPLENYRMCKRKKIT